MVRGARKLLLLVLVGTGVVLLGKGAWIPCKAAAAQILLHRAWVKTVKTGEAVKPWPWADTWPVVRIIVPEQEVDLIVLEGDSGQVLAFGPGHITRSSLPGKSGNTILAGHRDTSFSFLQKLDRDDVLILEAGNGQKYRYRVTETVVMQADSIYLEESTERWLTLITCYPFASINPGTDKRYIVFAKGE